MDAEWEGQVVVGEIFISNDKLRILNPPPSPASRLFAADYCECVRRGFVAAFYWILPVEILMLMFSKHKVDHGQSGSQGIVLSLFNAVVSTSRSRAFIVE